MNLLTMMLVTYFLTDFMDDSRIKIYDPGPRKAGIKEAYKNTLYDAIYGSHRGILIIEGK